MNKKIIFAITFALGVAIGVFGNVRLTGKKVLCNQFNTDYITNITCSIKLVNKNKETYSTNVIGKPGVYFDDLTVKVDIYYKFRTEFRQTGIKYEEDICAFLKNRNSSKFLISTTQFKNVPPEVFKPCPRSVQIKIDNLEIDYIDVPSIIPMGEYRVDSSVFTNKDGKQIFIGKIQNFFECSEIV